MICRCREPERAAPAASGAPGIGLLLLRLACATILIVSAITALHRTLEFPGLLLQASTIGLGLPWWLAYGRRLLRPARRLSYTSSYTSSYTLRMSFPVRECLGASTSESL